MTPRNRPSKKCCGFEVYAGRLKENSSDILARVNISGHCILPWNIGFAAVDESENATYKYYNTPYLYLPDGGTITLTMENLNPLKKYTIYPVIKYDDIEMFAPGIDVDVKTQVETLSATVKENTAILTGKASGDLNSSSLKVGFIYGKSEASMNKIYTDIFSDGSFILELKGLEYSADYLYKSFIEADQECIFGDSKKFKTEANKIQDEPKVETLKPEVKGKKVILKGSTNIDIDNIISAGFQLYKDGIDRPIAEISCNVAEDGMFYSEEVSLPYYDSDYYCQAFIYSTFSSMYGDILYFKTDPLVEVRVIDTAARGIRMEVIDLYPDQWWTIAYRKKGESKWNFNDIQHFDKQRYPGEPWDLQFYDLESSTISGEISTKFVKLLILLSN